MKSIFKSIRSAFVSLWDGLVFISILWRDSRRPREGKEGEDGRNENGV